MRVRPPSSRLLGALIPHERGIFDLLEQQAADLPRAGELLETAVHHWPEHDDLVDELAAVRRQVEAAGDAAFEHVHVSPVTALEREDLLGLSDAMSALVGHMARTAALLRAYGVGRAPEPARRLTHASAAGSCELAAGVGSLRCRSALPSAVATLRHRDLQMERLLGDALGELVAGGPTPVELLSWRDVYTELHRVHEAQATGTRTLRAIVLKGS